MRFLLATALLFTVVSASRRGTQPAPPAKGWGLPSETQHDKTKKVKEVKRGTCVTKTPELLHS